MNVRQWLLASFAALFVLAAPLSAQQRVPGGTRTLLLSGGQRNHHGYRRQAYLLQKLLEDTRQFEVTICEDAGILETPGLARYDIIIAAADRRDAEFRLTRSQQQALLKFVHDGKGLFSLHGFCCADPSWVPQMRQLLGGVLAHFGTPNTKVKAGKFLIKITDPGHSLTQGISDFEHEDELYYDLQTQGEIKPLAVAVYQGQDWPILWTRVYGQGRVCVSVFGHCGVRPNSKDPLEHAPFQRLIVQAIGWTAGREHLQLR